MSIKKLEKFSSENQTLRGLYLKKGEKRRLYEICIKYGIPITYLSLFEDDKHYYLWGVRKTGIGLIGTVTMNYLEDKGAIFQTLEELEEYLKGNKYYEKYS